MPYSLPEGRCLRQGDLIGNVRAFELTELDEDRPSGRLRDFTYSIVVSQDCDLEQDFKARFPPVGSKSNPDKLLFSIILCGAYEDERIKAGVHRAGAATYSRNEWKQIQQNLMPRFQNLGYVPQIKKIIVADFKDHFFVPGNYLYGALDSGAATRIASIKEPYREHLLQRFGFYMARIALPKDFEFLTAPTTPGPMAVPSKSSD